MMHPPAPLGSVAVRPALQPPTPFRLLVAGLLAVGLLGLGGSWLGDPLRAAEGEWIQLFNGKDLNDWKVKICGFDLGVNHGNTFRVEDGIMKVSYDQWTDFQDNFGHIFYKVPYSNYDIRVEYRFVGDQVEGGPGWAYRNSGIMIHGQSPESMGKDQKFPVSIEVQLLGGRETGTRTTGNLCTPGTHVVMEGKLIKRHCTNSTSDTYRGDRWVTAEVEVRGNRLIRHKVEGKVVLEYTQPQLDEGDADARKLIKGDDRMLQGGYISLQAESHPVEFRKVELRQVASGGGTDGR